MENRFCFCAVVRDESPNIQRCLESIQHLADTYLICDTGSVDDTIEKITSFMKAKRIPGEVIEKPWQNYGFNKSYLLWKLQNTAPYKSCKYICWLDADEVFITDQKDVTSYPTSEDVNKLYEKLESLSQPIYMFKTVHGSEYYRWQIARNNQTYKWLLPYQETFVGEQTNACIRLDNLINFSRHEGNSSRDPNITMKRIKMTEDWLERNEDTVDEEGFVWPGPRPEDLSRIYFYLAEPYHGIDKEKAIYYYQKRLSMGGWDQERYISLLRMSKIQTDLEDITTNLWRAIHICSERLEAYYDLMMEYKRRGNNVAAYRIGKMAPKSRTLNPNWLFVKPDLYSTLFDLEFSVICYWTGRYKKTIEISRKLLSRENVMPRLINTIEKNLKFSEEKLPPPEPLTTQNNDDMLDKLLDKVSDNLSDKLLDKLLGNSSTKELSNELLSALSGGTDGTGGTGRTDGTGGTGRMGGSGGSGGTDKLPEKKIESTVNLDEPAAQIIVIDNFYPDPDAVREYALKQDFGVKGNYPGSRTVPYRPDGIKERLERTLGRKINYWPDQYNGSFQIVTKEMTSWIHRDRTEYSAIVYLTPDPPAQGGTILYRHLKTGLERAENEDINKMLNGDSRNEEAWEMVDRIGNKYNRCIIFQGMASHKSDLYFGHDKETGRLFQTFFFNIDGRKF